MKNLLLLVSLCLCSLLSNARIYYVSTDGNNINAGTINAPFATWDRLSAVMQAGDTAYIRGGTYRTAQPASSFIHCLWQDLHGTVSSPINILSYPGEFPVFNLDNFITINTDPSAVVLLNSEYVHIKGLRITGLGQHTGGNGISRGMDLQYASHCTLEFLQIDNVGGYGFVISNGSNDNYFLNCDAHHLDDRFSNPGAWGNSNGFNCTSGSDATRNIFDGCRAWSISDDGFDFFGTNGIQTLKNCWSFWNGYQPGTLISAGDGDGFKLGPDAGGMHNTLLRTVTNCLAFENKQHGFNQNVGDMQYRIYNNTSFKNGGYGYMWDYVSPAPVQDFKNNVSFMDLHDRRGGETDGSNNSWNGQVTVTSADFASILSSGADAPRQTNGSLPSLNFLHLVNGSDLINSGINVGLPYYNSAPDLGAYEYSTNTNSIVDLVIIQGESNATGLASNSSALSSELTTRPSVRILNNSTFSFEPLHIGVNNNIAQNSASPTSQHGLELGLANEAESGRFCLSPLYLVKCGKSGSRIKEWLAGNPTGYWNESMTRIDAAIASLQSQGIQCRITVWQSMGLNDLYSDDYYDFRDTTWIPWKADMLQFKAQLRARYGSNIPFINTKFHAAYDWNFVFDQMVAQDPLARTVDETGTTYVDPNVHWDYNGFKLLASRLTTAMNTVWLSCTPAGAIPPVANAGIDKVVSLPASTVTLSGTGMDPDGSIISYKWTKISGPTGGSISSAVSATTLITALSLGIYQFELKVTDNSGLTDTDTVRVTVNAAANQLPVANAGIDQVAALPISLITLTGSGTDPDGTITAFNWTKISGPASGSISITTAAITTAISLVQGTYKFVLRVTDNNGATDTDTIQVIINSGINQLPVANAGPNATITLPQYTVALNGSGTDQDGTISAYLWTKISGPSAGSITNTIAPNSAVTFLVQGVYLLELKVTDNSGATDTDTMQIIVNAAPNVAPTANAGPNQSITLPVSTITLTGSGTDPGGNISGYSWVKIAGPASANITNSAAASTTVTGLLTGTYSFELKVTDNNGASARDTMQVIVNVAINQPPVANAGLNQSITLPVNNVTLTGTASDADGTIATINWSKIAGPVSGTITNAGAAITSVTGLVQGVYQFELTVTDNSGAVVTDIMQVTVSTAVNQPPVANAGTDIITTLPVSSVSLTGTGTDVDGTITAYRWRKITGPTSYLITNSAVASTTATALTQGTYQFEFKVTDNNGLENRDTMQVIVNAAIPPVNLLPNANAGADQIITLPVNVSNLNGSGTDPDGTITAYLWKQISGPAISGITNSTIAVTTATGFTQGTCIFELTVTDNNGAFDSDTMRVTVNAAINHIPIADAGPNQTITLPLNSVTLSGSGTDQDGTITAFSWIKIAGPVGETITIPNSALTTVTGMSQGLYQFQLTVTDNSGATNTDIVQVNVSAALPPANILPDANAGPDLAITLPVSMVIVNGIGIDPDGTVTAYAWRKLSGPAGSVISNSITPTTSLTFLLEGDYIFELKVTDNNGGTDRDTMQVLVYAAPNLLPVANAGTDQNITLPVNTVFLNGSGTDADGNIVSYSWTRLSGPANGTITNTISATTSVTGLGEGVYQYELKVTDDSGAINTDTTQVTVNAALNLLPSAEAGANQTITLPVNSVMLGGSGSDPDGSITTFTWLMISGPAGPSIANPLSAITMVSGLVQGVYQFQLTVTDNSGATDIDLMQVNVNPEVNQPPTVNAGPDQLITLPVNTITLNGSGSDPDGTITVYRWKKLTGPATGTITNTWTPVSSVTGVTQGIYTYELKVTDNAGAIARDTMQVIVNPALNQIPSANAGADQVVTLPTSFTTLTGSGNDPGGAIAGYSWIQVSGPTIALIADPTANITTVSGLIEGIFIFQLTVTDDSGVIAVDVMQLTINPAPNQLPIANAGSDENITLPNNTALLHGSGLDPDGTIIGYLWTKISGPANGTITNTTNAIANVSGLVEGIYSFQLKVTDNSGATATDQMEITIYHALNLLPIADAGADIIIMLPTNAVALNGSGIDPDGSIIIYSWAKISGPLNSAITDSINPLTTVTGLQQGVYEFELTVTDDSGAIATDIVQITVEPAPNQLPVANAGADQTITLPVNSITLSGSATDADGIVTNFDWSKLSGPAGAVISDSYLAITQVTGLVQGVYQFKLTVTDNSGETATDLMQVTVNPAPNQPPTANAGPDLEITLPINTVVLNGIGTDTDGNITIYRWRKISGPVPFTILNTWASATSASGLVVGIYQFEFKVTDNNGGTSRDTMQVTVNPAPNQLPIANAGSDQTITLPTSAITLTGTGHDPDGTIIEYAWLQLSGPANSTIANSSSDITPVNGLIDGIYVFQLTVTDDSSAIAMDTMQLTVNPAPNQLPAADAGPDQNLTLPLNSATVTGSGTDPDGSIIDYQWTQISGPSIANISSLTSAVSSLTSLIQGAYAFELQVTDNNGATAIDIVEITVNPAPNELPTSNAGMDMIITLPTNTITLSGSGTDPDGAIISYSWINISGPGNATITDVGAAVTTVTGLLHGVYMFQLSVTDNSGAIATDLVQVLVNPAPNELPTANAGPDQNITLPINSIVLTGIGADPDGYITIYRWKKIAGPTSYTITNYLSAVTSVTNLVQGVYKFELKVTDNNGATRRDTMKVTVHHALNQLPIANAGPDQIITLPTNSITLTGSGTDPDGMIVSYLWTKISGPASGSLTNTTSAITNASSLVPGTYIFKLEVTDNSGALAADFMQLTVEPAPNQLPTANAGTDLVIVLPTNTVTLNGTGTDPDGTIITSLWTKTSGPAGSNLTNPSSPITLVTGLVQGIYIYELKVTDNSGATATDIIQVTVDPAPNQLPIANAGTNITITLPINTVTLNGSGADPDGFITAYLWIKLSGPAGVNITTPSNAVTTITNLVQGIYKFQLKVTDNNGATSTADMQVTVNAALNLLPTANAGTDQSIILPLSSVTLNGSGTDPDGIIIAYLWTKISGPGSGSITAASNAVTTATSLVIGVYTFQLKVTDNNGASDLDTIKVTVMAPPNILPVANAGGDIIITLPENTTVLNGNGFDSDGTIIGYQWKNISGPISYTITNQNSAITNVTGLVAGMYKFELTVTDNSGGTGKDTILVQVNPAHIPSNKLPIANAGRDIYIELPLNMTALPGSGTDPDGFIVGYSWRVILGSPLSLIHELSANAGLINLELGTYEAELTVTDNNGAKGIDTVKIFVIARIIANKISKVTILETPFHNNLVAKIESASPKTIAKVLLFNSTGALLFKTELYLNNNIFFQQIDMTPYPIGTYVLHVYFDKATPVVRKVVKTQ
ncbi:MAG: Ig-like domain-containing protein [Ferruginibacter sp.]